MFLEKLQVLKTDNRYMWLENKPKTTCGGCEHNGSCGVSSLAKVFKFNRDNTLKLKNDIQAKTNDWVEITISDSVILKSSFLIYMLPLLSLILGAILFQTLFSTEPASIIGALLGLFISTLIIKNRTFNILLQDILKPSIIKVIQ